MGPADYCAGIIYAIISPPILVVGVAVFALLWLVYAYQAVYVLDTDVETAGLLYWQSLNHLFLGVYTMNLFLVGLFVLRGAIGPTAVTFALTIGVTFVQRYIRRTFHRLVKYSSASNNLRRKSVFE